MNLADPQGGRLRDVLAPPVRARGSAPTTHDGGADGAVGAVFDVGYYGAYVRLVDRLRSVFSRAAVRRRLAFLLGGVLVALGVRTALES